PVCVVPGCHTRDGLEIDHIVPFAEGGATCLANLCRLCRWHHYLKTHQGCRVTGGPGDWRWELPEPHGHSPPDDPPSDIGPAPLAPPPSKGGFRSGGPASRCPATRANPGRASARAT